MSGTVTRSSGGDRDANRRRELGAFLRTRREQLTPDDVGLASHGRRRVRGLRREEVALLASVSLSWYTWLEQARNIRMSPDALDAVAKALRLGPDEHRYFRRLAGSPVGESDGAANDVPRELVELLEDLMPNAAHIVTGPLDLVAWNRSSALLFGDPERLEPEQRNSVWMFFMTDLRERVGNWEASAHDLVARLRNEAGKYPDDPRFAALIDDLLASSDEFREIWHCHEVRSVVGPIRTVHHPDCGIVRTQVVQLRPAQISGLILFVHRPADDDSRASLVRLVDSVKLVSPLGRSA
jgi:transcriptional regulator with XRE-family HTH domain